MPSPDELATYQRQLKKKDVKDYMRHKKDVEEELVPRATGREAQIEKKRALNDSRRARQESPEVNNDKLMYATDFQRELARRRASSDARKLVCCTCCVTAGSPASIVLFLFRSTARFIPWFRPFLRAPLSSSHVALFLLLSC